MSSGNIALLPTPMKAAISEIVASTPLPPVTELSTATDVMR